MQLTLWSNNALLSLLGWFKSWSADLQLRRLWMWLRWFNHNFGCSLKLNKIIFFGKVEQFESTLLLWERYWLDMNVHHALVWRNIVSGTIIFFKFTMFVNYHITIKAPLKGNPCIEIWFNLANNQLLSPKLYEWLKLIDYQQS